MKKIAFLILIIVGYAGFVQVGPASAQVPVVVSPVINGGGVTHNGVHAGDSFLVEIQADAVTNLAAAQFDVDYDPLLLAFDSATVGATFDDAECISIDSDDGVGTLTLVFACSFESGDVNLVLWNVVFTSIDPGTATVTPITVVDDESLVLNDNTVGDPVLILATGTSNSATIVVGVCGDQNDSGTVNVVDITIDLQIVVELFTNPSDAQLVLSDLNRDGSISVADAIIGLQGIVGLVTLDDCGPLDPTLAP